MLASSDAAAALVVSSRDRTTSVTSATSASALGERARALAEEAATKVRIALESQMEGRVKVLSQHVDEATAALTTSLTTLQV
jgi:phosphopantothenate synthetase